MAEKNWENNSIKFTKRPIEEILKEAKTIDPLKVCNEILAWLITNVENYVDSDNKIFKLDLILDNVIGMFETTKLQDLYRSIPDDDNMTEKELDEATKCREELDKITLKAHEHIKGAKEVLEVLFKRMIFYYEKIVISPENKRKALAIDEDLKQLIKEKESASNKEEIQNKITAKIKEGEALVKFEKLDGVVNVSQFVYEAFSVGVQIKANKHTEEEVEEKGIEQEKEIVNEYNIPEGFALWLELTYKHKTRPTSIF